MFNKLENMPEYPGGNAAMVEYLSKKFHFAKGDDITRSIWIGFVINTDGTVIAPQIIDRDNNNKIKLKLTASERELIAAVKKMPRWKPAIRNGKKVLSYLQIPFFWRLLLFQDI